MAYSTMHLSFRHIASLIALPIYCNLTSCTTAPSFPLNDKRREEIFGKTYFETLANRYYLNDVLAPAEAARNRQLITSDRKEARNAIIRGMMLLTDEYFSRYCNALYSGRAAADTATEALNSGITATATLLTPGHATRTLTAIASGLSGLKLSVDKNLFIQQTAPALVAKMQAQRTIVDAHMQQMMRKDVADYPLEEGMRDFVKYYQAGTLLSAASALSTDANLQNDQASETLQSIKLTPSKVNEIVIPSRGFIMRKVVPPGPDPSPNPSPPSPKPPTGVPPPGSGLGGQPQLPTSPPSATSSSMSLLPEAMSSAALNKRNDTLKNAFASIRGVNDEKARPFLKPGKIPPQGKVAESLAEQVLEDSGLQMLSFPGSTTPALDSLDRHIANATTDESLKQVETTCRKFKIIP